ncbi:MAG: phosphoribosylamine--glycine ligase [Deltaproteobacteria bacterium]|nr:phosphoribosylamine--glycine ligase [Deltaproteobacteria bacterium]
MKVLVIGGGGREHALCWKIRQSPLVTELHCAPGNAGIAAVAQCVSIKPDAVGALVEWARGKAVDLTVVGPELPLTLGLADAFHDAGLRVVGPRKGAAKIEGSKAFGKDVMQAAGIPTAEARVFDDASEAERHVRTLGRPCVVKADGLAAGKGVFPCLNRGEAMAAVAAIMREKEFGDAGARVVIEDYLEGEEVSFIALTDGETIVPLASSQDHKRVNDGDQGYNTGGMGAYSPAPVLDAEMHEKVMARVMRPAVKELARRGEPFRGFLYAGLMIAHGEPHVLEFNARLGDPETQPLMFRLRSDIVPALVQAAEGTLRDTAFEWDPRPSVCVVMTAKGYPGEYPKGMAITGLDEVVRLPDTYVFHAATGTSGGAIVTSGGRILGVTALGFDFANAIERAYQAVDLIRFESSHYRHDIGKRALRR